MVFIYILNNRWGLGIGDWGLGIGIGDWGLGIGDWAQSPIPNPQSPIPNPHYNYNIFNNYISYTYSYLNITYILI